MEENWQAATPPAAVKTQKRVVLMGASIGREWNIPALSERMKNNDYVFEYVGKGAFDKSAQLEEILLRREGKPDAVLIKECAAYFPGDLVRYQQLIGQWVAECRKHSVIPIPATVVPVTRLHSFKKVMIDIVKLRNPAKYGNPWRYRRNEAILSYNDWLRDYCRSEGLSCLDLESAVRNQGRNRFLRGSLARMDGLHLNKKGYRILDRVLIATLDSVSWPLPTEDQAKR